MGVPRPTSTGSARGRAAARRVLRAAELHRRAGWVHHWPVAHSYRFDDGGHPWLPRRAEQGRHDVGRDPEDAGLLNRAVRQEPPGRPRGTPSARHGFDKYWGNLYHLNANEDLEDPDRPTGPAFRKQFDPRGVISGTADGPTRGTKVHSPSSAWRHSDDEITARSLDYLERRAKDGKPFFLWHAATRNHVFLHLKDSAEGQSRAGKEDIYGNGLKEHDGHVGQLLNKLDKLDLSKNTIVIYTTDNGAYQYMWPEGGTTPFRGDKGTTWEGGVRVPCLIRWPGAAAGRVSSDIVDMTDLLPTLAAAADEPGVIEKLKKGATFGGRNYKLHLDGFDQTALFTGQSDKSARNFVFYYDETTLTAIRYQQFKITFSAKFDGHWDDPLQNLGRPMISNMVMDPFERQWGDLNRQYAEHKGWVLTPILGVTKITWRASRSFPCANSGSAPTLARPSRAFDRRS